MMRNVPSHGYGFKMGAGLGSIRLFHIVDLAQLYVLFVQRILPCMAMGMALSTDIARDCVQAAFGREGLSKPDQPQTEEFKLVDLMGSRRTSLGGELGRHIASLWAGHWGTHGTVAVKLGWHPKC
jgi:hypothetical protein